jgi:hypothetical protein
VLLKRNSDQKRAIWLFVQFNNVNYCKREINADAA